LGLLLFSNPNTLLALQFQSAEKLPRMIHIHIPKSRLVFASEFIDLNT
jgi:hypothetical protein